MNSSKQQIDAFNEMLRSFWQNHARDLPWRQTEDPYCIYVSEIMLQQTQVSRVIEKYENFIQLFPSFEAVANASVADVLKMWQGLGYNRRALSLKKTAEIVVQDFSGIMPQYVEELTKLPGIGIATASAICAYAFNQPVVYIETNIRRVFIHHFFTDREGITDAELMPLVEQALNIENPRRWYSALMDYGTELAKQVLNPNRKSKHYTVQSKFEGSLRQLRGAVLRSLGQKSKTFAELAKELPDERLHSVLEDLQSEGFIELHENNYQLKR